MKQTIPLWRYGVDAACLALALVLGALGLLEAYGASLNFILAAVGGLVAGLALAWANVHFKLGTWRTLGLFALLYLVLGTPLATPREAAFGLLPTGQSLRTLLTGLVFSWKDMLTVAPPVGSYGGVLIVAFLSALLTALLAGLAAWHLRSPYWTLLPLLAMFVLGIVFGTRDVPMPVARGVAFIAVLVGWLAWRRFIDTRVSGGFSSLNHEQLDSQGSKQLLLRRVIAGTLVLAGAGVATAAATPLLAPEIPRQVLRDALEPPVDLYDYPSPLTRFRKYVKTMADDTLMTVKGLPKDERIRLAALDSYNGMVINVDPSAGGSFAPVGDASDIRSADTVEGREAAELEFSIKDYQGVWVPSGGKLLGMELTGGREDELARSLFYSDSSESALSSIGLAEGDAYTAKVLFPAKPSDEQLNELDLAQFRMPELANVPAIAGAKAAEFTGSGRGDLERVRSIEAMLSGTGFFSNGTEGQVPSLSGHGAGRITSLLDAEQMIGDDEQYAVAMALMAREQGIPARVVMGFYPEEYAPEKAVEIKGSDVHAWVEIAFEDVGWVAFNPTPNEDEQPTPPEQEPKAVPQPQVLQPPPPAQEEADLPPQTAPEPQEVEEEPETFWERWGQVIIVVGISLGSLLLLLSPLLLIALLKLRRREKRAKSGSTGDRMSGGWQELLSHATDHRIATANGATRRESASVLAAGFPALSDPVRSLAQRADAANFSHEQPTEEQVRKYWEDVIAHTRKMQEPLGFFGKMRVKYSPRSLIHELAAKTAKTARILQQKNRRKPWR
ncbi:DUF4129 domain-containing transglutaminase family protein [Glutamicibacter sp. PAEs-4]|uniref:DUF4129 domain-containing transglutaminase family protein n=1 Tax=Glutamicibacter sp. PAEs-4 TaxID=3444114 RepID=UPI003EB7F18F